MDHKNSQRNLGSLVSNPDLASFFFGCVDVVQFQRFRDCPAVLCSFGIAANVQTIKDGLLRHHSACCLSPRQWALPTRCPSDEPDPLLKDSDFTRSQPTCSRSFICLSSDAPPPPTHRINESQSFLAFTITCFVFGRWSIACGTLCRSKCAMCLSSHCFSLCMSSRLPDSWFLTSTGNLIVLCLNKLIALFIYLLGNSVSKIWKLWTFFYMYKWNTTKFFCADLCDMSTH